MRKYVPALVSFCLIAASASAATWTARAPLPAARCADGSVIAHVNGSIFLIGAANDAYDIAGNSWSAKAPNPRVDGRTNLNSNAVLGTQIFFLGGTSVANGFDVSNVDRYDVPTNSWALSVASTFLPNASLGTIPFGGSIYSFGGTRGGASNLAFRLTPPTSVFIFAGLGAARVKPAVVEYGGNLWVIGGRNGAPLTSVEVFNPLFGTSTPGPSLPVASTARAAGVVGGDIHVLLDAGLYRLSGGSWIQVGPPAPLTSDYAAIFVGDDLHAVGGCGTGNYVLAVSPLVADTTPPVIASVTPSESVLTPPNHKLVPVTVSVVASDDTDPAPSAHITTVTSSEPDNGLGDGDTAGDIAITGPLTLQLRAERAAKGAGRTYTITVLVTDASGNSSSATTTVLVPRDQKK
jgi:hypothetical protein